MDCYPRPLPTYVCDRPDFACPSRTSPPPPFDYGYDGGSYRPPSRVLRMESRRASRQCSRLGLQLPKQQAQQLCGLHPLQDCCVPRCCPPPSQKCPMGVYVERTKSIRPDRYYEPPSEAFHGLTTYRENYNLKCGQRAISFKPGSDFGPSSAKLDGLTTYKEAYTPKPLYPYRKPEWSKQAQFDSSDAKMEGVSTYRNDYVGCAAQRPKSLKPVSQFDSSSAPMDDKTTYRTTFVPYCRLEYSSAKQPSMKQLGGGPDMSCAKLDGISTYRHDYTGCMADRARSVKPLSQFQPSCAPMDGNTTYRTNYIPFYFRERFECPTEVERTCDDDETAPWPCP